MAGRFLNTRALIYVLIGFVLGVACASLFFRGEAVVSDSDEAASVAPSDTAAGEERQIASVIEQAEGMLQAIGEEITDYTAILTKQQRIDGSLGERQVIEIKVQHLDSEGELPQLRVYLHFIAPSSVAGREVIWGADLNDGKLIAHEGGLMGLVAVSLDPEGAMAMRGQKYPVYKIGIENLAETMIERATEMAEYQDVRVTEGTRLVGDVECRNIIMEAPKGALGPKFARVEFAIDPVRNIPLRYAAYGPATPDDPLPIEDLYEYTDVKLNAGLSAADFDPDNPAYSFP